MGFVSDLFGGGGDDAAKASRDAAQIQADYQNRMLDYLMQQNQLPTQYRDASMNALGNLYGITDMSMQGGGSLKYGGEPIRAGTGQGYYSGQPRGGSDRPQMIAASMEGPTATTPTYSANFGFPEGPIGGEFIPVPEFEALPNPQLDQAQLVNQAQESALYDAMLGGLDASEEAILRNQAATGGLRSGDTQSALAQNAQDLQNEALLRSYNEQRALEQQQYGRDVAANQEAYARGIYGNQTGYNRALDEYNRQIAERQMYEAGLQGLAFGAPNYTNQIANTIGGIGTTLSQGEIAAAQARQQGQQNQYNNLLGLGGLGAAFYFSDIRLKDDIKKLGTRNGLNWYSWKWNDKASSLGLSGTEEGYMAHEVGEVYPDAVGEKEGYLTVNYEMISGMNPASSGLN